jgi:hypothetical protein
MKRKRVVISVQDKLTAIKRLDKGESLRSVAKNYGVGISTVSEWRKNRKKIEQWCSVLASPAPQRKSMKKGEYNKIDETLYLWFTQQRDRGIPISGPILQQKAIEIGENLPVIEAPDTFTASDGWLSRWKRRHGIRQLNICGEKLSANQAEVENFKQKFKLIMEEEEYTPDQIYNCDETGLYYKMLPSKTLAGKNEHSAAGYKKNKDRVTILACGNFSGRHKLRLMCIGKSAKPRAFKNVLPNVLPVYYQNQKSAWMDSTLFKKWFHEEFVPGVEKFLKKSGQPRKALLLIDNAPSHASENELRSNNIKVMFLPPNVTALMQPMDQGVLENFKRHYRRNLLESILERVDGGEGLMDCLKAINLKNVVYWAADAWNKVKSSTLQKSWAKIIHQEDLILETNDEEEVPLHEMMRHLDGCEDIGQEEVEEWVTFDNKEQEELTDVDLIELINEREHEKSSDTESEGNEEEGIKISHLEAFDALNTALLYVEQQPEATASDILLLTRWRNIASKNRISVKLKQSKVDNYFFKTVI